MINEEVRKNSKVVGALVLPKLYAKEDRRRAPREEVKSQIMNRWSD